MAAVCVMSVWALLAYGFLGSNKAVQNHVNCLYVLYALERLDPGMPRALIFEFRLHRGADKGQMKVRVFTDGTFDMREIRIKVVYQPTPPQLQESGGGCCNCCGHTSGALWQHACHAQHRHRQPSSICCMQVQRRSHQATSLHSINCARVSGNLSGRGMRTAAQLRSRRHGRTCKTLCFRTAPFDRAADQGLMLRSTITCGDWGDRWQQCIVAPRGGMHAECRSLLCMAWICSFFVVIASWNTHALCGGVQVMIYSLLKQERQMCHDLRDLMCNMQRADATDGGCSR